MRPVPTNTCTNDIYSKTFVLPTCTVRCACRGERVVQEGALERRVRRVREALPLPQEVEGQEGGLLVSLAGLVSDAGVCARAKLDVLEQTLDGSWPDGFVESMGAQVLMCS